VDGKSRPAMRPAVITKSNSETRRVLNILAKLPTEALPGKVLDVRRVERIGREYRPAQQQQTADVSLATTRLLFGDMRQRGDEIADASVDLIFCDPPYGEEFLPLWSALSRLAARVLKRGGLLVAYTGQVFLPEVMGRLAQHLRYWWQGALVLNGPQVRIYSHRMANGSKPLLFYSRNDGAPEYAWCEDTYVSEKRDKDLHEWQQSIGAARHFISRLTALGDTVLDPFLGSGTTGAAALELGRHFIGIECDSVAFATAQERLSNITTAHENEAA
ncbi:MAG: DNA-methyltransferase, partial [Candidatus Binatia bacterium]